VTDIYPAHKVFPEFVYIGPASSATTSPVRVLDFDTALDALKKTGNIYNLRDAAAATRAPTAISRDASVRPEPQHVRHVVRTWYIAEEAQFTRAQAFVE
jgi:hypothetical protein